VEGRGRSVVSQLWLFFASEATVDCSEQPPGAHNERSARPASSPEREAWNPSSRLETPHGSDRDSRKSDTSVQAIPKHGACSSMPALCTSPSASFESEDVSRSGDQASHAPSPVACGVLIGFLSFSPPSRVLLHGPISWPSRESMHASLASASPLRSPDIPASRATCPSLTRLVVPARLEQLEGIGQRPRAARRASEARRAHAAPACLRRGCCSSCCHLLPSQRAQRLLLRAQLRLASCVLHGCGGHLAGAASSSQLAASGRRHDLEPALTLKRDSDRGRRMDPRRSRRRCSTRSSQRLRARADDAQQA
jgi:hypothetical protein